MTVEALAEAKAERTPKPASAKPCAAPELRAPGMVNETSAGCGGEVANSPAPVLVSNAAASACMELAATGLMAMDADRMSTDATASGKCFMCVNPPCAGPRFLTPHATEGSPPVG